MTLALSSTQGKHKSFCYSLRYLDLYVERLQSYARIRMLHFAAVPYRVFSTIIFPFEVPLLTTYRWSLSGVVLAFSLNFAIVREVVACGNRVLPPQNGLSKVAVVLRHFKLFLFTQNCATIGALTFRSVYCCRR